MKAGLVVWCMVVALTVGLVQNVVAEPKGEMVYALHVTIAPAWFDPAEMPAQITPFSLGIRCMMPWCALCLAYAWGQRWQSAGVKARTD